MTRRERILLIVVGTLGVLLLFYFYAYAPRQAEYQRLTAQLAEREAQLSRMEATARQITTLRAEFARLQAFIADIEAKLPAQKETPVLLVQLERLTRSLGINLQSIRPGQIEAASPAPAQPQPGARPSAPPAPGGAAQAGGLTYRRFPITLVVDATYEQMVRLATELNDFPRMIAIRNLSLQPKKMPTLSINLDVETYVLPKEAR